MLDRRRTTWLDRVGRRLAGAPPTLRFGVALAGLLLFVGISAAAWSFGIRAAEPRLRRLAPAAAPKPAAFNERLERITEIAKSVFLDLGLSRDHFITQLADPRQFGSRQFDFLYWEVWAPPDFEPARVLERMKAHKGIQAENVQFEEEAVDQKTHVLKVSLDGINTHRFLFTKAAQEAPEGARVLLANAPTDATTIDIAAIPEVKYAGPPRLAIVIDDIGVREAVDRLFFTLPAKVTLSVLPFAPTAREMAAEAKRRGHEIMLHLPMEPLDLQNHDPGQGKLLLGMGDPQIRATVETDLAQVPDAAGVNNHMGSAFTRDPAKIRVALAPIKARSLFFLDSMTIGDSAAYRAAKQLGVRSAARNLFLDYNPDLDAVRRQVELAGRIARAQGQAIAIGHPFQNTFLALQEGLPKLLAAGVQIVPVGQLAQ